MIGSIHILKLVLVVCMNSECTQENAYTVDNFASSEYADAMDDCRTARDEGNAQYEKVPVLRAELHCWTPKELADQGFDQ